MMFEWDESKNKSNWKKHKVDFKEAESVFEDDRAITVYDTRHSTEGEERFQIIGMSRMVRELTVCHCVNDENAVTRIISARRATKAKSSYMRGGFEHDKGINRGRFCERCKESLF